MVPNPQQTQQFLSSVLSQRGPSALPYHEDTKWLIRQHLVSLTTTFPSLEPKTATFTHNDGRSVNLLQADGTIPMTFQGVTYNIPIIIWLIDSYPRHAPLVFVNPTRDMIIKRPHQFVNPSGLVAVPYLQNWVYPSSNLVDLVRSLGEVFGRDPPLYSQRRPSPSQGPSHQTTQSGSGVSVYHVGHSHQQGGKPIPPPRGSFGGSGAYPVSPYGARMEDPNEAYKRNAVNKIVEMVHGDMVGLRKSREAEMEGLFSVQSVLRQREEELRRGVKEMTDEKEELEQQLQMVLMNSDVLDGWLKENQGKLEKVKEGFKVDEAFECLDLLSKQMLDCTALDLAVEDVVYELDKAVQDGAIPFDQYLRNVRLLSREQFFHRATAAKVRAAQMQAQVASMAARLNQYAS